METGGELKYFYIENISDTKFQSVHLPGYSFWVVPKNIDYDDQRNNLLVADWAMPLAPGLFKYSNSVIFWYSGLIGSEIKML